jgi:glycosyltransferase involved in cell wall biosynthesis
MLTGQWELLRAYYQGWLRFLRARKDIRKLRMILQSKRVIDDRSLLAIQKQLPDPFIWRGLPELTLDLIGSHYFPLIQKGKTRPLPEFETLRHKFLIISNEIIDSRMAGPGMRYLEMARAMREDVDITLAIPSETTIDEQGIHFVIYSETRPADLRALVEAHDIALVTAFTLNKFTFFNQVNTRLVVDLYDPYIFENLFYYLEEPLPMQVDINVQAIELLNQMARLGDFFICGSERQRDLWLGLLAANQRINPYTFAQDRNLRGLIDVVGIGFPDREPYQRPFLRGTKPEFSDDCRIVLWGGGLWDWLDPLTLVQAWPEVVTAHPEARLVFLGTRHPNPDVPQHRIVPQIEALAEKTGEKGRTIFFFEWLSYSDREALLSEADIGVTLHTSHIETHFSIRTRVLDYMWARLPLLVSSGDVTSQWVREYNLGSVVQPESPEEVAQALRDLLSVPKQAWFSNFDEVHQRFKWADIITPLRAYLLTGDLAPDHIAMGQRSSPRISPMSVVWRSWWARARFILRTQGFRVFFSKALTKLRTYLSNQF